MTTQEMQDRAAAAGRDPRQTNSATLLVGDTGAGKTTLLQTLIEWGWIKYRKVGRLYATDPGGFGDGILALVEKGICQVYRPRTRDPEGERGLPLETLAKCTKGWWPQKWDPLTGNADPEVELVAPRYVAWEMYCPQGHRVLSVNAESLLVTTPCPDPTCRVATNLQNCQKVERVVRPNPGFEDVGVVCFDSIHAMAQWAATDLSMRAAKGTLGGEKGNLNTLESGSMKFGVMNRGGVGFIQQAAPQWVQNALSIHGLVVPPAFTALELRATDDKTNLPIYGPLIIGIAKTAEAPSWFGNCLGVVSEYPGDKGPERRIWFRDWTMPGDNIPHKAKVRATARVLPDYVAEGPDDEPLSKFNLGVVMEMLEGSYGKAKSRLETLLGDAEVPGLPTGEIVGAVTQAQKPTGRVGALPVGRPVGRPVGKAPGPVRRLGELPAVQSAQAAQSTKKTAPPPPTAPSPGAPPQAASPAPAAQPTSQPRGAVPPPPAGVRPGGVTGPRIGGTAPRMGTAPRVGASKLPVRVPPAAPVQEVKEETKEAAGGANAEAKTD